MKGPYERLKYDLRRLWECPQCHRRERTDGTVTFRQCSCQTIADGVQPFSMRLMEESGHRTVPPIVPTISDEPPAMAAAAEPPAATELHLEPPAIEPALIEPAVPDVAGPPDDSSSSPPPG